MLTAKQHRGSALLTALFIMTLVAIVATAMSVKIRTDIYRTQLVITRDKLYLASQALTFWALSELSNEKNKFYALSSEQMVLKYPKSMETIYDQITIQGGIYDLQSRFNLNNLADSKLPFTFTNLINVVLPTFTKTERANFSTALRNWVMPYDLAQGRDAFTSFYLNEKPPYYPSHQIMASSSELRLVKNASSSFYLSLTNFITALPETTAINVNTAPLEVLMSLGKGLTKDQANEFIQTRGTDGIKKAEELNDLLSKFDIPSNQVTIESHYFLSVAYVKNNDSNLIVYTLLKRNGDEKNTRASIIRESIGYF